MQQTSKKTIYIFAFTFLGVLFGYLIHMLLEIWYIRLLLSNFERYNFGLSWAKLFLFHKVLTFALMLILGYLGLRSGKYWWVQIYVLKRWRIRK